MSFDVLQEKIIAKKNPTVAGLDPKPEQIPPHILKAAYAEHGETLAGAAEAVWQFNKGLIDALKDVVPAVKPQAAYYERLGWQGLAVMEKTIAYAKEQGLFVIADIKRGDIGSTAQAYADAWLGETQVGAAALTAFGADCVTLNGYMGSDTVGPFVDTCKKYDKCLFLLAKTSNPGSGELQNLTAGDKLVYQLLGDMAEKLGEGTVGKYGYSLAGCGRRPSRTWRSSRSCAPVCLTPSSWCLATAPRAAPPKTCSTPLTRMVAAPSSMPPGPSCAPGRRPARTAPTSRRPPVPPRRPCGTPSADT